MTNLKPQEFTSAGANVDRYVSDLAGHALGDGGHEAIQLRRGAFRH
jgi:hypothetical protein